MKRKFVFETTQPQKNTTVRDVKRELHFKHKVYLNYQSRVILTPFIFTGGKTFIYEQYYYAKCFPEFPQYFFLIPFHSDEKSKHRVRAIHRNRFHYIQSLLLHSSLRITPNENPLNINLLFTNEYDFKSFKILCEINGVCFNQNYVEEKHGSYNIKISAYLHIRDQYDWNKNMYKEPVLINNTNIKTSIFNIKDVTIQYEKYYKALASSDTKDSDFEVFPETNDNDILLSPIKNHMPYYTYVGNTFYADNIDCLSTNGVGVTLMLYGDLTDRYEKSANEILDIENSPNKEVIDVNMRCRYDQLRLHSLINNFYKQISKSRVFGVDRNTLCNIYVYESHTITKTSHTETIIYNYVLYRGILCSSIPFTDYNCSIGIRKTIENTTGTYSNVTLSIKYNTQTTTKSYENIKDKEIEGAYTNFLKDIPIPADYTVQIIPSTDDKELDKSLLNPILEKIDNLFIKEYPYYKFYTIKDIPFSKFTELHEKYVSVNSKRNIVQITETDLISLKKGNPLGDVIFDRISEVFKYIRQEFNVATIGIQLNSGEFIRFSDTYTIYNEEINASNENIKKYFITNNMMDMFLSLSYLTFYYSTFDYNIYNASGSTTQKNVVNDVLKYVVLDLIITKKYMVKLPKQNDEKLQISMSYQYDKDNSTYIFENYGCTKMNDYSCALSILANFIGEDGIIKIRKDFVTFLEEKNPIQNHDDIAKDGMIFTDTFKISNKDFQENRNLYHTTQLLVIPDMTVEGIKVEPFDSMCDLRTYYSRSYVKYKNGGYNTHFKTNPIHTRYAVFISNMADSIIFGTENRNFFLKDLHNFKKKIQNTNNYNWFYKTNKYTANNINEMIMTGIAYNSTLFKNNINPNTTIMDTINKHNAHILEKIGSTGNENFKKDLQTIITSLLLLGFLDVICDYADIRNVLKSQIDYSNMDKFLMHLNFVVENDKYRAINENVIPLFFKPRTDIPGISKSFKFYFDDKIYKTLCFSKNILNKSLFGFYADSINKLRFINNQNFTLYLPHITTSNICIKLTVIPNKEPKNNITIEYPKPKNGELVFDTESYMRMLDKYMRLQWETTNGLVKKEEEKRNLLKNVKPFMTFYKNQLSDRSDPFHNNVYYNTKYYASSGKNTFASNFDIVYNEFADIGTELFKNLYPIIITQFKEQIPVEILYENIFLCVNNPMVNNWSMTKEIVKTMCDIDELDVIYSSLNLLCAVGISIVNGIIDKNNPNALMNTLNFLNNKETLYIVLNNIFNTPESISKYSDTKLIIDNKQVDIKNSKFSSFWKLKSQLDSKDKDLGVNSTFELCIRYFLGINTTKYSKNKSQDSSIIYQLVTMLNIIIIYLRNVDIKKRHGNMYSMFDWFEKMVVILTMSNLDNFDPNFIVNMMTTGGITTPIIELDFTDIFPPKFMELKEIMKHNERVTTLSPDELFKNYFTPSNYDFYETKNVLEYEVQLDSKLSISNMIIKR